MNFVESSLKYKQVTISILLIMFILGIYSLLTMPRREDPKITIPTGLIVAFYPGATSEQVENQVTKKIEEYLFKFEEVRKAKTFSTTKDGLVVISVDINGNVKQPDIFWNKLRHNLLVARELSLPEGVIGPIVDSDFGDTEAVVVAIDGNGVPEEQLKSYLERLQDKVRTIPSASKIKIVGEQNDQILITLDSEKLSQYNLNLQDVIGIIQSQNKRVAAADLDYQADKIPIYTDGNYNSETEISNQIIGTSNTGQVIKIADVAEITRQQADPTNKVVIKGNDALLLTIQMHEGNNIVDFGEEVQAKIDEVKKEVPSNVNFSTIINQPQLVDENVSHFIREFFISIVTVVLVVILLLPFRVSLVAATAIPVTIAVTFALMHIFKIELHQVSLAALIVVLGMVVDDAIVVADNYVELLDKGVPRWEAAWRSASDLTIPILAATMTIIASFFPMVLLTGSVGEFIYTLPITVTIALSSSFIVAMVFTPMLCFFFIKKGLHDHENPNKKKRKSLLDYMQIAYDKTLALAVKLPILTIGGSLLTLVAAFFLYTYGIKQKFFPAAERNQFVVEVWMPTGTNFNKTEEATNKVLTLFEKDKRVVNYASFIGGSAPRFYYNFSPEFPKTNYAQILINTTTKETTDELSKELIDKTAELVPDANIKVKLMQQGQPTKAPVEIRIIGEDLATLKSIEKQIEEIAKNEDGTLWVDNDFGQDYYSVSVKPKPEAQRLGFTSESIAQAVYIGFSGASITKIYEGDKPVDVVLKFDKDKRKSSADILNMYVQSPVTKRSVPLRQIADIQPAWYTGNIVRRNGERTLTVQAETIENVLPSQLLTKIQEKVNKIDLPDGYRIEYGGEFENQKETFGEMIIVLAISIVLIFLIILLQFKNIKETFIIMITIPLSLFGALFGLYITDNNFGFTAFVGLISLSGIVVRNAIILIDHTNELIKEGMDIRSAAIISGQRRLRPIFLTAMAAAFGVLPMIISRSPMWSPLASVIAVGVIWSMIMALITVPVMYIYMINPKDKRLIMPNSQNNESNESTES